MAETRKRHGGFRALKRVVRPPLEVEKGKRHPLNMRATRELRGKIEAAAWRSGRSMTQEVEYRLERSFWEEEDERDD